MCGPEGIAIFYVNKQIQGHLRPTCISWMSVKNSTDFDHYRMELQDSIKRYDSGCYNLAGVYGLGGAIEMLLEIGVENIAERVLFLTDRLCEGLRDKGYRIFSSRDRSEASGVVSFISDVHDHEQIQRHLQTEHRLVIAVRRGRLRASPHFYNAEREIDQLIEQLPQH
jgi:selenocysteine lyase/cysteine desulfurase